MPPHIAILLQDRFVEEPPTIREFISLLNDTFDQNYNDCTIDFDENKSIMQ